MKNIIAIIPPPDISIVCNYFLEGISLFDLSNNDISDPRVTGSGFYKDIQVAEKLVFNGIKIGFGEPFLFFLKIASTSRTLKEIEFISVNFDRVDTKAFDAFFSSFSLPIVTFKNVDMKLEVKNQMIKHFEEYNHKPLKDKKGHYEIFQDKMFTFFKIKYSINEDTHQLSLPIEVVSEVAGALYQISDHVL